MRTSTVVTTDIECAVAILRDKGIVAFPTDTLYGLGADAFCLEAVERVFEAKGRPTGMALPLLLRQASDMSTVASKVPDLAWLLAEAFWPGPLTLVLTSSPRVPDRVTAGKGTVAVRVPDHPVSLALIEGLGRPITGTSANTSGGPNPLTVQEVKRMLGDKVDCILEGGPPPGGKASTVLDVTTDRPRVLRAGALSIESLEAVCKVSLGGQPTRAGQN